MPPAGITVYYRAQIKFGSQILTTQSVARGNQIVPNLGYVNRGYCTPACGNAINQLNVGMLGSSPEDFLDEDIKHDRYLLAKAVTVSIENFSSNANFYFEANSTQPCGTSSN